MISCKRQLLFIALVIVDLAFSLSSTLPVATFHRQLVPLTAENASSSSTTLQEQQSTHHHSKTTPNSFVTGIVILVLTLLLLFIFFVVFFHYRSIRLLPDEPATEFQPSAPKRKILVKPNTSNNKMGAKNSVSTTSSSGSSNQQQQPSSSSGMKPLDLDKINAISSNKMNMTSTGYRTMTNSTALFELTPVADSVYTSNDSVYTSIDNTSELDSIELDSESLLNSELNSTSDVASSSAAVLRQDEYDFLVSEGLRQKKRTKSYENFVLTEQNPAAFASYKKSGGVYCQQKELVILNVMNVKKMKNEEKSYL